jgi:hypothetical protein
MKHLSLLLIIGACSSRSELRSRLKESDSSIKIEVRASLKDSPWRVNETLALDEFLSHRLLDLSELQELPIQGLLGANVYRHGNAYLVTGVDSALLVLRKPIEQTAETPKIFETRHGWLRGNTRSHAYLIVELSQLFSAHRIHERLEVFSSARDFVALAPNSGPEALAVSSYVTQ